MKILAFKLVRLSVLVRTDRLPHHYSQIYNRAVQSEIKPATIAGIGTATLLCDIISSAARAFYAGTEFDLSLPHRLVIDSIDVDRLRLAFQGSLALVLYTVQVRVRAMSAIHTLRYPPPASGSFTKCTSTLHGLTCTKRGLTRDCCAAALPRCNSLTGEIAGVFGAMS